CGRDDSGVIIDYW
nr:immunoglobulin heavy chain junction region [Macaca mulatta]MOV54960.1 immunoglobulin heavy chain junction region [Macaca mulatta]MOV55422.1 immunoglobulin heavy chain junction region [Macaca mulatta]MOV55696.1 immunoglobulin heavy chain junction region [Macaca mulatta]MOV55998.1 immunoglobulin heavy chain junction region [Macaca mulatta]